MKTLDTILDLLDDWRHLPDYQLERRADIFFAVYLPHFLSAKFGIAFSDALVPEFPLRIGTLFLNESNQSCKVDYLAVAADLSRAVLLELKTDSASRRETQDVYLEAAKKVGLPVLLDGLLKIVCASDHKHKYCHLLRTLERHRLFELPPNLPDALSSRHFRSKVNACVANVKIIAPDIPIEVIYLEPVAACTESVGFSEMAVWLSGLRDPLALRFSKSLTNWATLRAGYAHPATTVNAPCEP